MPKDPIRTIRYRNSSTVGPIAKHLPDWPDDATAEELQVGLDPSTVRNVLNELVTLGAASYRTIGRTRRYRRTPLGLAWINGTTPIAHPGLVDNEGEDSDTVWRWIEPDDDEPTTTVDELLTPNQ